MLRRRSLAKLRHEIEPVDQTALGRFSTTWQGIVKRRHGADALLDAIEQLQGAPLPASILDTEILAARIDVYDPADLDAVTAAGEVVWVGVEPLGEHDGRVALFLTDSLATLKRPSTSPELTPREKAIVDYLGNAGASFFDSIHQSAGGGFPNETVDALWSLVWKGVITNDTFRALRAYLRPSTGRDRRLPVNGRAFRSRRVSPPSAEGR